MVEEWGLEEWWLAEVPEEPPKQHDLESFWSPVKPKKDLLGSCSFPYIRQVNDRAQRLEGECIRVDALGIAKGNVQHRKPKLGLVGPSNLGDLR